MARCVNIKSPEFKALVKSMNRRERFVARAVISQYQTDNNTEALPDFIQLKQMMSDVYNSKQGGVDYGKFYGEVKAMVKRLLPGLSEKEIEERVRFVDKMEIMRLRDGMPVLSTFINNTIYLSKTLPKDRGSKAYTDARHEVFHMIFNNFLSEQEQIDLLASFKRWKPQYAHINDKIALEERMADEFETYKNATKKPSIFVAIKEFFESVARFFGFTNGHYNDIQRLFNDVESGKFTRNFMKDSLATRDKSVFAKYQELANDPDLYLQAKTFMLNNLNQLMFPESKENLSATDNKHLFLKTDDEFGLFGDNPDLFKMGLSKEEALTFLYEKVVEMKNSRIEDPQLSRVIDTLSSQKFSLFKDLFNYLQPYSMAEVKESGELELKKQVNKDGTEDLLEGIQDFVNPNNLEIGSKELINPIVKISEVVKDFISSITYKNAEGNQVNIDAGVGFVSLLHLLGNLYGNKSVQENAKRLDINYDNMSKGNQSKAVYEALTKLHKDVINFENIFLDIKTLSEENLNKLKAKLEEAGLEYDIHNSFMDIYLNSKKLRVENIGTNNIDNKVVFVWNRSKEPGNKKSWRLVQQQGEANKNFIERVARQTGLPNFIVAKLFRYNEQRNTLAEVTKVAGSLRTLNPKFVKVEVRKTPNDEGGFSISKKYLYINSVKDHKTSLSISGLFRNKLEIESVWNNISSDIQAYRKKGSPTKGDLKGLLKKVLVDNDRLSLITFADFQRISEQNLEELYNKLQLAMKAYSETGIEEGLSEEEMKAAEEEVAKEEETGKKKRKKRTEQEKRYVKYLRHTSNFADLVGRFAIEKNAPTSFNTSSSNKSKWENVMKNTGYMIFKNLEDFYTGVINKKEGLLEFLKNSRDNYLRFNPILEQDYNSEGFRVNRNMLRVGEKDYFVDNQETFFENKFSKFEQKPIPFGKESRRDWINRNFLASFVLPVVEEQSANKSDLSYFQQKMQPESAPNVSSVKMGISNAQQLEESVAMMILQEAWMHHKYANSATGNLSKNVKKSYLPGLEKSNPHYFLSKDGNQDNIFFDSNGNLNEGFGKIVNGKLVINKDNPLIKSLVKEVFDNLDNTLNQFVDIAINERATIVGSQVAKMAETLRGSYMEKYKLSKEDLDTLRGFSIDDRTNVASLKSSDNFAEKKDALKKAMSIYYMNSFVNGYFMNQLSSGATQNYKTPLDEVKRQAGVNAMNDSGLIDNDHGMPQKYNNVVISSVYTFFGNSHPLSNSKLLHRFFLNTKNERADAQSYKLPEFARMFRKSFGKSTEMGAVTKDVHYENSKEGITHYRKTSTVELTNELVRKNTTLRDLRYELTFRKYLNSLSEEELKEKEPRIKELFDKLVDEGELTNVDEFMEYENLIEEVMEGNFMIHEASFESAMKGSKPKKLSKFKRVKETGTFRLEMEEDSVLELDSSYTGIQQSVRHRYIDSYISHFTQLTYLTGLNRTPTSIKNNKIITSTLGKMSKAGLHDLMFQYKAFYEEGMLKVNNSTKSQFIKDLIKKLDLPGNEKLVAFLNTPGISMNNPLFSEKLMQTFFNSLSKKTVSPKHPGGSFVLQSEFGFEANTILKDNSLKVPEIVSDKNGNLLYAECYLPAMYSGDIAVGEMMYYNNDEYNKMFGFRIPSSDLHSSVPLKVIGYYPNDAHDNIVVIPTLVTALHGSDFDVDKLFVVRHGVFESSEDSNAREFKTKFQKNNQVIAQAGVKFGHLAPDVQYNDENRITSWGNNKHIEVKGLEDILLDEKLKTQERIIELEKPNKGEKKREKMLKKKEIKSLEKHLKTLSNIQGGYYSNVVLDAVLDNISYSGENAADVLFGITFDPMKGYDETSEASHLSRIYSEINKAKDPNTTDIEPPRPKLFETLEEAKSQNLSLYDKTENSLKDMGIETSTEQGKKDLLSLINESLKSDWVDARDEFIERQRMEGTDSLNLNRPDHHVNIHKETYMAAGLVGLIANFSKGLAYAFHGITDGSNSIKISETIGTGIEIDGVKINELVLENEDGVKNQELKSLALNAAIDHVKEQILNMLNVGENTAKIFLSAISTRMTFHQASMLMLQPAAKELSSSNVKRVSTGIKEMTQRIADTQLLTNEMLSKHKLTTADMEELIKMSFDEVIESNDARLLTIQWKVLESLKYLDDIGQEVSDLSRSLSILQELPFNLETAYDKLEAANKFVDVVKLFDNLKYTEKGEYGEPGFKDNLQQKLLNVFSNVNVAENENVLAALESIKFQIDMSSELFTENSLQLQYLVDSFLKAMADNSDPSTIFMGENNAELRADTTSKIPTKEKYLRGKTRYNVTKIIAKNILNYLTTGLNIPYNKAGHIFSLGINSQALKVKESEKGEMVLGTVRSYLDAFLMRDKDLRKGDKYAAERYLPSQINPEWRLKPLSLIKEQNRGNKFLDGLGIDMHYENKLQMMTFNTASVNTDENFAEIALAFTELNSLPNIYVRKNEQGEWEDVPASEHPVTEEMSEAIFNIIKSSLYSDQFKFSSSRATSVIPPIYFKKLFESFDTLLKDSILYRKNPEGKKYYKDYSDMRNVEKEVAPISDIKENLFINTIFSLPHILPNVRGKYNFDNKRNVGMLPNGNIYDFYIDASKLKERKEDDSAFRPGLEITPEEADTNSDLNTPETGEKINEEAQEDLSQKEAEEEIYDKFKKNPAFLVDESYDKPGRYELYMKVGELGNKDEKNLKYYYKKIANINSVITNNSFDLNQLLNNYRIASHFNPQRFAIPVAPDIDFSGERVTLKNVKISSFLTNAFDGKATVAKNKKQIAEAEAEQLKLLKEDPANEGMSEEELKYMVKKTRIGVENLLNKVNEVSLFDTRNLDRTGIRNFRVISKTISADKLHISYELEALPLMYQNGYNKFDRPLNLLEDRDATIMTREQMIEKINSVDGMEAVSALTELTEEQLRIKTEEAMAKEAESQIDEFLNKKDIC